MGDRLAPIRGEITEIVGGLSSGRTSHLLACLGEVVDRGETAALIDTEEIFEQAQAFMQTVMPGTVHKVKLYRDENSGD